MKRVPKVAHIGARQAWLWRNRFAFGNAMHSERPRVLVDVSAILRHDAQTGIQRVVRAVWSELLRRSGDLFVVLPVYATSTRGYCYAPTDFLERKGSVLNSQPVSAQPGDKFLGLDLSAHLLPNYRRQLKAWRAHGATIHLLVYDLLPLLRPDWFSDAASAHFQRWFDVLRHDADQAICISDQVAIDLSQRLAASAGNGDLAIGRLRMGADIGESVPSSGLCADVERLVEQLRFRSTVLMVGTIEPRKGYEVAISAFEHLWRARPSDAPDLVIVGKGGWKTAALQQYIRSHPFQRTRLHWLDRVSDEGLCLLYQACRGVFVASRGEGFGLPLIEAALHRRPVLARDLPVFREHRMPNISFFQDDSPAVLAERLMELVSVREVCATVELPAWSDCVDGLLREIGLLASEPRELENHFRKAS